MREEIVIIGGGLGGLTAAYLLAKKGKRIKLVEKKSYPFHRVCGEYVSNEVKNFLINEGLYPQEYEPVSISRFQLSSLSGKHVVLPLDLGGFGISRYNFDDFLFRKCKEIGVEFLLETQVLEVDFSKPRDQFTLTLSDGMTLTADYVLGAFGKRSRMDKTLNRRFIQNRTSYIGIKYHVHTDFPSDLVALHNYEGGYLGINKIENEKYNVCYLGNNNQLKAYGSIPEMEKNALYKNPFIKELFQNSDFLFDKPEVINDVNFSPKEPIVDHILMIGDAAGLITPLCGNGMAIAIHSGKLASEAILTDKAREEVEELYRKKWTEQFKSRLWLGRKVQKLFGSKYMSGLSVSLLKNSNYIGRQIIKRTHGKVIE